MNRLNKLFENNPQDVLSIYFTAGFPNLNDTLSIAEELEKNGVELIEIGMPFSDPLADGPVIQESSTIAIKNGMTIPVLFEQLKELRKSVSIPVVLMGYLNPIMQFGFEKFLMACKTCGIDGLIIPDLTLDEINEQYDALFKKHHLSNISLVTPQTSNERIKLIERLSNGFVYFVSSSSITGSSIEKNKEQLEYFEKIKNLKINNAKLIGFGISNHQTFSTACKYANGAIVGTAFINALKKETPIKEFIQQIKFNHDYTTI